ncbi:MAG TPA: M1 family metallopeptidase, partial [Saprospiraceae bacterium]|nr:M1 family metallopeptidase [Saprospiraceae bacterium]
NDDNYLFTMTQWYPRMCVYSDFQGWQNHQFSGRAEFALTFGDFHVEMTVPSDHVVCATGECQNYDKVLTPAQLERWKKAQTASDVMEIVTLDEAKAAEKKKSRTSKTYIFEAKNVRDFAWGSSRKFVWDALPVDIEGKKVMAMSFYGKEAYGLYRPFSTKVVAHTIRTYSHFTIPYPYPVAQSVEASNGMEYPMICFNYGRTEEDGTYSEGIKNGMIGVIIHEVGHNFFPMIINSDERQWTWMDEGLNTFVEYLTEELWDNKFPSKRGPASSIVNYMKLPKDELEPIMTNSDNIVSFGPNAYAKPATGLNILRETIMGRELFDHAFRNYCRKWAFKHPTPADFFRSMEDASGEDLDWFWRGWFYSTDACDISLDTVKYAVADVNATVKTSRPMKRSVQGPLLNDFDDISKVRNREDKNIVFETDRDTTLRDFYWKYARNLETQDTTKFNVLWPESVEPLDESLKKQFEKFHAYELTLSNKGGLVMPVIIEWTYTDGSKEVERISAQIWRKNENKITKSFIKEKEVASILIDPFKETADIDESNNGWNVIPQPSKFKAFKQRKTMEKGEGTDINPMNVKKRT